MEVEAKFVIPDHDTLLRLRRVVRLGPFVPGEGQLRQVRDLYLDTAELVLYQNGYACRIRHREDAREITLKGLGQVNSAIHERFESNLTLCSDSTTDPATWPEEPGRELVSSLVGDELLKELFTVEQVRHVRPLAQGERLVAELSVDEVCIVAGEQQREVRVLEAELAPDGTTKDLEQLVDHLTTTWGLFPEPRSKYHLGLALLGLDESECDSLTDRVPMTDRVSSAERAAIQRLVENAGDEQLQQRARLILGWGEGLPVCDLCEEVGLSLSWSYELIKRFREQRMSFFGAPQETSVAPRPDVETESPEPEAVEDRVVAASRGPLTVEQMCERYQVDMAHACGVRDLALALFDATLSIHKLDPERRRLLSVMGLLHNVGLETDPDRHHVAGRDIILENSLVGVSEIERRMLAAAVYLHRKRMRRKRLRNRVVVSLPPSILRDTLVLAAFVRLADGLDYSQSQTSALDDVQISSAAIHAIVSGPYAQMDAARAQKKADLWEKLFDVPFFFSIHGAPKPDLAAEEERVSLTPVSPEAGRYVAMSLAKSPGVLVGDAMGEAGRKVLYFHFVRMLEHEPGTRAGEDIEELHDMRVATRRMRSAFRVFAPYYKKRARRGYVAGLKRTGRVLGAVRDLDVFVERARTYLDALPSDRAHDLDPLFDAWREQREQARSKMIDYLDSDRYRDFVDDFGLFVQTPGAAVRGKDDIPPTPTQVGHLVPQLVYERWANVQAFGSLLDGAPVSVLHALRISCKRLRYTLEFFCEVLGPEVEQVIDQVVQLQDHLGNLNDASVANAILSDFLFSSQESKSPESVIAPGVVNYLAANQRELQTLIATFPQVWEQFSRPKVRRSLADAIAVL